MGRLLKPSVLASIVFAQVAVGAQARTGTVAGVIRAADGSPAANIRVTAMAAEKGPLDAAATYLSFAASDENGRYRLENIPPGRYHIVAGRIDVPTYYPGTTDRSGARDVLVAADAIVGDVDFVVDPASLRAPNPPSRLTFAPPPANPVSQQRRVAGQLVIPGRPSGPTLIIGSARVRAERLSDGVVVTVESAPNGRFTLSLEDGEYRIQITPPRGYAVKSAFFESVDLRMQPIRVDPSFPPSGGGFGSLAAPAAPEIVITLVAQNIL
jgi:hypothetical protein